MKNARKTMSLAAAGVAALVLSAPARAQVQLVALMPRIDKLLHEGRVDLLGSGTLVIPTGVLGRASAVLENTSGEEVFALEADLTRCIPLGSSPDEEGGVYGRLLRLDPDGTLVGVAYVEGAWLQHPDGNGQVAARILGRSDDPANPVRLIGVIEGRFFAPTLAAKEPTVPGKLYLRWRMFE